MLLLLAACSHLEQVRLQVDGVDRSYYLHRPEALPPGAPVVLMFHGGGGWSDHKGRRMSRLTGFDALADREGFVAVFPNALHGNWNDGRGDSTSDDLAYVGAVVDRVLADTAADPGRVYAAGFSNGAFLVQGLACARPERFAAFAAVSGTLPTGLPCDPARPVRILMVAGTDDPVVLYAGGPVAGNRGHSDPVDATAAGWVDRNGCADPPVRREWDEVSDDGTRVHEATWCGGTEREVRLLKVEGGGHGWPGGPPVAPRFVVGRVSDAFDATDEVWRWFSSGPAAP